MLRIQTRRIMSFYAVAIGREIGIYDNWAKCEEQIKGYRGARYKKFQLKTDAEAFIYEHNKYRTNSKKFNPRDFAAKMGTLTNQSKSEEEAVTASNANDFWPPSDGDTFDECQITDEELLLALAEIEGLPTTQVPKASKRKMESESASSSKMFKHEVIEPSGLKHVGNFEFQIDSEGHVIVYTDGSCFNNGSKDACAGYGVYFGDDHPLNVGKPVEGRVTNNVGEIQASIYAVKTAKLLGIKKLCICTDSQFLIKSATTWIRGWKAKNWRLKNGDPVKNVDDFKELDDLLKDNEIVVKWNYVAGHKGIKGNEMADRLAREGSETYRRLHLNNAT